MLKSYYQDILNTFAYANEVEIQACVYAAACFTPVLGPIASLIGRPELWPKELQDPISDPSLENEYQLTVALAFAHFLYNGEGIRLELPDELAMCADHICFDPFTGKHNTDQST